MHSVTPRAELMVIARTEFIASAGTYANLVKQAKSKQKVCLSPYP